MVQWIGIIAAIIAIGTFSNDMKEKMFGRKINGSVLRNRQPVAALTGSVDDRLGWEPIKIDANGGFTLSENCVGRTCVFMERGFEVFRGTVPPRGESFLIELESLPAP